MCSRRSDRHSTEVFEAKPCRYRSNKLPNVAPYAATKPPV